MMLIVFCLVWLWPGRPGLGSIGRISRHRMPGIYLPTGVGVMVMMMLMMMHFMVCSVPGIHIKQVYHMMHVM